MIEWERLEISSRKLKIQGNISCKDRLNKGNSMDLTEAEDFENRWQECTELFKKDLNDLDNHGGVITH